MDKHTAKYKDKWKFHIRMLELLPDPNQYDGNDIIIKYNDELYYRFTKIKADFRTDKYKWVQPHHVSSYATLNPITTHDPENFIKNLEDAK